MEARIEQRGVFGTDQWEKHESDEKGSSELHHGLPSDHPSLAEIKFYLFSDGVQRSTLGTQFRFEKVRFSSKYKCCVGRKKCGRTECRCTASTSAHNSFETSFALHEQTSFC